MAEKPKKAAKKAAKKGAKKAAVAKPAKGAKKAVDDDEDEAGDEEDEGPEFVEEDIDEMSDDMLASEDENESKLEGDDLVKALRKDFCDPCEGIAVKKKCKIYDEYKCPPGKKTFD